MAGLEEWSSPPAARRKARWRRTEFGLRLAATLCSDLDSDHDRRSSRSWPRRWPPLSLCGTLRRRRDPAQGRPRPGDGREPEFPPPTIRDYKPRSTLVVPQHPVPRAKFPVIDIHSHQPTPISAGAVRRRWSRAMDALNLQVLVNAQRRLRRAAAAGPRRDCAPASTRTGWCCSPTSTSATSGPGLRREGGGAARGRHQGRALGLGEDLQGLRLRAAQDRRHPPAARRSRARSDLGHGRAAEHPGVHPHRRPAGVLRAARLQQRALARAGAVSAIAGIRRPRSRASRS